MGAGRRAHEACAQGLRGRVVTRWVSATVASRRAGPTARVNSRVFCPGSYNSPFPKGPKLRSSSSAPAAPAPLVDTQMFRQNRQPSPAEAHAQRIEQRAISGQAYEQQRVESDPYAPSRLDSFRAQQGQPIGQQEQQPPVDALTPRRRLDSFRQQQGQPVAAAAPMNGGLALPPSVPGLGLGRMSDAGQLGGGGGSLNTDRGVPLSTRRLKKEVLRADSSNAELSNQMAGHVMITDSMGTPRNVRVVQQQARFSALPSTKH